MDALHPQQLAGMLCRVGHRGSCDHKSGAAAVRALAEAPQPPQHQGGVAAKHACRRKGDMRERSVRIEAWLFVLELELHLKVP